MLLRRESLPPFLVSIKHSAVLPLRHLPMLCAFANLHNRKAAIVSWFMTNLTHFVRTLVCNVLFLRTFTQKKCLVSAPSFYLLPGSILDYQHRKEIKTENICTSRKSKENSASSRYVNWWDILLVDCIFDIGIYIRMYAYIYAYSGYIHTHIGTVSLHTTRLSQHTGKDKESKNVALKCTPSTTDKPQASDIPRPFLTHTNRQIQKISFSPLLLSSVAATGLQTQLTSCLKPVL